MLFSIDWNQPFSQLRYTAPAGVTRHILTGLTPGASYAATVTATGAGVDVTLLPGGDARADAAGVLVLPAEARASAFLPMVASSIRGN